MTPASVGVRETALVLGKHSGRHAVESRLRGARASRSRPTSSRRSPPRFKALADQKKFVYDDDLLALRASTLPSAAPGSCATRSLSGNARPAHGHGRAARWTAQRRTASAVGNGPLDAALKAADAALGLDLELLEMHTRAVTAGNDALAEVIVRVRHEGTESTGPGGEHRHHRGDASRPTCRRWPPPRGALVAA